MRNTAQPKTASTQKFTEVLDIREDIVLLQGGDACIIVSVQAVNFALLSSEEQEAKVYAYAALLNSLSFPIQIVIRSKKIDIMPYIHSLEEAATKTTNDKLTSSIRQYKNFVEKLVTVATVLDKQFYFVISYSQLEQGVSGVTKIGKANPSDMNDFFTGAKAALHTKAESLLSQIDRMSLRAKILEKDALVHLFHDIYNGEGSAAKDIAEHAITAVKGGA